MYHRDTLILMSNGSVKRITDIINGEKVLRDDGIECTVIDTDYNNNCKLFIIKPDNIIVSEDTYLVLKRINTNRIVKVKINESLSGEYNSFKIPILSWKGQSTPMDPYKFGLITEGEIPLKYRFNNINNRESLLAGIIENPMTVKVNSKSICIPFHEDILFLINSLGYHHININNNIFLTDKRDMPYSIEILPLNYTDTCFSIKISGDRQRVLSGTFTPLCQ